MAVSGSKDFSISRTDIIAGALRKIGEYDVGEGTVPADETDAAALALNLKVKALTAKGIDLWLRQTVTLFLQPQTQIYNLGSSGSAHASTSIVESTLSAAEAASQTVLSITSTTGMTAADNIGIKLDDDSIHWTTITTVDSSTQVTVPTGLASGASSGNKVYTYTTKADRPQRLLYAYRRDTNDHDTEVAIIGENEYHRQSNKTSEGPPVEVWYRPELGTGKLHVWPIDGGSTWDKLIYVSQVLADDFDAAANEPEFPIEWGECLTWQLADEMAYEYGVSIEDRRDIERRAKRQLDDMLDYDVENADVQFQVSYDGR